MNQGCERFLREDKQELLPVIWLDATESSNQLEDFCL